MTSGVQVASMWTRDGHIIIGVDGHEIELTPEDAAVFASQILQRIARIDAWTRAEVGEDAWCELTDTIDPGDDA